MLISIQLTLISEQDAILPPFLGRANYAATLARLAEIDEALAQQIHGGDGPKPLTCSSLSGAQANRDGTRIQAGRPYRVRITGLTPEVTAALETALIQKPPSRWELDKHPFRVAPAAAAAAAAAAAGAEDAAAGQTDPWSGRTTYEELAAAQVVQGGRPRRRVTLRFASPTAFKSAGMTVPIPLPGLVFGSLVERWNAFSPIRLSPEMRRFGEERVAVSRYKLESRPVAQKGAAGGRQALRMGAVGEATYIALGGDRYWLGVMQMLARFALYSGVGVQTATGMGQVRCVG